MLPECRNEGGLLFNPGNFTVIFRTVLREKSRQKIFSGIWQVIPIRYQSTPPPAPSPKRRGGSTDDVSPFPFREGGRGVR